MKRMFVLMVLILTVFISGTSQAAPAPKKSCEARYGDNTCAVGACHCIDEAVEEGGWFIGGIIAATCSVELDRCLCVEQCGGDDFAEELCEDFEHWSIADRITCDRHARLNISRRRTDALSNDNNDDDDE